MWICQDLAPALSRELEVEREPGSHRIGPTRLTRRVAESDLSPGQCEPLTTTS